MRATRIAIERFYPYMQVKAHLPLKVCSDRSHMAHMADSKPVVDSPVHARTCAPVRPRPRVAYTVPSEFALSISI